MSLDNYDWEIQNDKGWRENLNVLLQRMGVANILSRQTYQTFDGSRTYWVAHYQKVIEGEPFLVGWSAHHPNKSDALEEAARVALYFMCTSPEAVLHVAQRYSLQITHYFGRDHQGYYTSSWYIRGSFVVSSKAATKGMARELSSRLMIKYLSDLRFAL